jgi:hypothetical protein
MFLYYLAFSSAILSIVPLVVSFSKRNSFSSDLKPFFYLVCLTFFAEGLNIATSLTGINNQLLLNVFTVLEFTLLTLFYKHFFSSFFRSTMFYFLIGGFLVLATVETFIINDIYTMGNISTSVEALLCIFYSVVSFFLIMKNLVYDNLLKIPFFWINTAVLIYFAGNLFLFLFSTYLQKNNIRDYGTLYIIHSILNITYYILISIGFWKVEKK